MGENDQRVLQILQSLNKISNQEINQADLSFDSFLTQLENQINSIETKLKTEKELRSEFIENLQDRIVNNFFEKLPVNNDSEEIGLMSYVFNTYLEELEAQIVMRDNFELIFNSIDYHVIVIDESNLIRFINDAAKKFYGIELEDTLEHIDQIENKEFFDKILTFKASKTHEESFSFVWIDHENNKVYLQFKMLQINFEGKDQVLILGEDVTRKRLEGVRIMRATLHGQELERDRLSKELHDSLAQNLNAAMSHFNASLDMNKESQLYTETVQTSKELMLHSIDFIRKTAQNLKIENFENKSFVQSITDFTSKLKNLGPEFIVSSNNNDFFIDNKKDQLFMYRVIQEFVNNTLKHANAKMVYIFIKHLKQSNLLQIKVLDDGKGFDMEKTTLNNGVYNIQQRLKALNADYKYTSSVGKGTQLKFTINLSRLKIKTITKKKEKNKLKKAK